jgi:uncharacterized protein YcnI
MFKKFVSLITSIGTLFILVQPAFAHVVVKPNQVGVAQYQTFTIGVPNEKEVPVTALKLLIPDGVKSVMPNVKPGWTVNVVKTSDDEDPMVIEIDWTGGSIPAGQRDDFLFSAQVPATETSITWKAYQTYKDGSIVSWDQEPVANQTDEQREEMEQTGKGPYSQTKIINDLIETKTPVQSGSSSNGNTRAITYSIVALALSIAALSMQIRGKKK